jgi:hypothetical protein
MNWSACSTAISAISAAGCSAVARISPALIAEMASGLP